MYNSYSSTNNSCPPYPYKSDIMRIIYYNSTFNSGIMCITCPPFHCIILIILELIYYYARYALTEKQNNSEKNRVYRIITK